MRTLCAVVLGVVAFGPAAAADEKDAKNENAKKIIGKWEITKAGGDVGAGSTLDFAKDGKFVLVIKDGDKSRTMKGNYKIDKDKVTITLMVDDTNSFDQTLTIKKLTDDAMELVDENQGVDVLKRKKEA
jgi:uncharacterized protein (TIGR03066 family)